MARFLTDAQVNECVGLDDVRPAIEAMLASSGRGDAVNLTRRRLTTPNGYLAVMGGALVHDGVLGVKTFTHTRRGYSFQVSLYDGDTGELLLYTQANRLGQIRTGATTAVAISRLANHGEPKVGIIGTGNQAGDQLRAVCQVRDVSAVQAYSRNPVNRQAFAERMARELGIPVAAAASNQDAVADMDIVICIASAETPVVAGDWLSPGTTVVGAGPTSLRHQEVDADTLARADRRFVDSMEQAPLECGDISTAVEQGRVRWGQFHELRHVVSGLVPGRMGSDEIVYCKLMGTGLADVAAAKVVLDRAERLGIGTEFDW